MTLAWVPWRPVAGYNDGARVKHLVKYSHWPAQPADEHGPATPEWWGDWPKGICGNSVAWLTDQWVAKPVCPGCRRVLKRLAERDH